MLMPNPEYRSQSETRRRQAACEPFDVHSSRNQLVGLIVLMMVFAVAIGLRWLIN